MARSNICPICSGPMQQNQDAIEWLKCHSCGYGDKKVNFGRACNNCQCILGKPCFNLIVKDVMETHKETLKKLGDS